jgi:cell division protein YceG involved in septum cleavage
MVERFVAVLTPRSVTWPGRGLGRELVTLASLVEKEPLAAESGPSGDVTNRLCLRMTLQCDPTASAPSDGRFDVPCDDLR